MGETVMAQGERERRIVVGVDGSAPSKAALSWAIRQAKLTGAVVEAVIAWHYPSPYGYASIVEAARSLDRHHVGHLVVAEEDGSLAGIISPRDLLKVYLRTDEDIRGEILGDIIIKYLGTDLERVKVAVDGGIVTLRGEVEHKSMVPLAARLTRAVDGVVDVKAILSYAIDDSHLPTASDLDPQQRCCALGGMPCRPAPRCS
jgi:CBS domain-containing protein